MGLRRRGGGRRVRDRRRRRRPRGPPARRRGAAVVYNARRSRRVRRRPRAGGDAGPPDARRARAAARVPPPLAARQGPAAGRRRRPPPGHRHADGDRRGHASSASSSARPSARASSCSTTSTSWPSSTPTSPTSRRSAPSARRPRATTSPTLDHGLSGDLVPPVRAAQFGQAEVRGPFIEVADREVGDGGAGARRAGPARGRRAGQRAVRAVPLTNVLVFTKTAGYRHASSTRVSGDRRLGRPNGCSVGHGRRIAVHLHPTCAGSRRCLAVDDGDVLTPAQKTAFEGTSLPAAATSACTWRPTRSTTGLVRRVLVGAYFAVTSGAAGGRPCASRIGQPVDELPVGDADATDECRAPLEPASTRGLLSLYEASYDGGAMGDHPVTWCQRPERASVVHRARAHRGELRRSCVRRCCWRVPTPPAPWRPTPPRPAQPRRPCPVALRAVDERSLRRRRGVGEHASDADRDASTMGGVRVIDRGGTMSRSGPGERRLVCAETRGVDALERI